MAVDQYLHMTPDLQLLRSDQFDLYDHEHLFAQNLKPSHLQKDFSIYSKPWELADPRGHENESVFSNSPVESDFGSADTESSTNRDDDYIAELTRQMAHFMLQEDHDQKSLPCTAKMEKTWRSAGSPQSTPWSPLGSSHGSPDIGPSQEESFRDGTYDQGLRSSAFKPGVLGFNTNPALADDQLRAMQFYALKQRAMKQQGSPNWGRQSKATHQPEQLRGQPQQVHEQKGGFCVNIGSFNGGKHRTTNPWTQSPTQTQPQPQPQPQIKCHRKKGSVTRMFVLGGESSSESSCTGTGVFLPRGIWYSSEPRKKQGCSTVFIPARVVQALQLHFDQMGVKSQTKSGGCPLQHVLLEDGWMGRRNDSKQKQQTAPAAMGGLPQEWKY